MKNSDQEQQSSSNLNLQSELVQQQIEEQKQQLTQPLLQKSSKQGTRKNKNKPRISRLDSRNIIYNQKVVQRIERKKQQIEEEKKLLTEGAKYQLEDYFTEQNKWHCNYIYNIFKKCTNKWQNQVLIPAGLNFNQDQEKYKQMFEQNEKTDQEDDIYYKYKDQLNEYVKEERPMEIKVERMSQIKKNKTKKQGQNLIFIIIMIAQIWYVLQSLQNLKNINVVGSNWEISVIIAVQRITALVQFFIFNKMGFIDNFEQNIKEICTTQLIMAKDKEVQKKIECSTKKFILGSYVVLIIGYIPYFLNNFVSSGIFNKKYQEELYNNQIVVRILGQIINIAANASIVFPRFILCWTHYIMYIIYEDFVEKAVEDWMDEDSHGVDFYNIMNIQIGIGHKIVNIDNTIQRYSEVTLFMVTVMAVLCTYTLQKFLQKQYYNMYDMLQICMYLLIQYMYLWMLYVYSQKISKLKDHLCNVLETFQQEDTPQNEIQKYKEFSQMIQNHLISFHVFNFELNQDNIKKYYILLGGFITQIFAFKS